MSHIKKLSPLVGESVSGADERGKCEQTCEMIRTGVRKLAPIASQGPALPSQRRSVSLCFCVAMLLKTQFVCHRIREGNLH